MKDDERQMVNWFKNQLKSYLSSAPVRKRLEEKVAELDNKLDYHSPSLTSDAHVTGKTHDEKLADYVTKRDEYMVQLSGLKAQQGAVEAILRRIPKEDRESIIRIHKGLKTMETEAFMLGMSKPALQRRHDYVILRAIKKYLNGF